jgi:hypothetical protein
LKKIVQLTLLLSLILGYSFQSQAALLIEPLLGYSFGSATLENKTAGLTDTDKESINGVSYGGRLGYQNLGFQLGLDYLSSRMSLNGDDFNTGEWGGFVGFEFPILVRVYAGYIFSGTADYKTDTTDIGLSGGTGAKFGIGFTMLPFLDLNIEYRAVKYDMEEDVSPGRDLNLDYSAIMVGISLPFTI